MILIQVFSWDMLTVRKMAQYHVSTFLKWLIGQQNAGLADKTYSHHIIRSNSDFVSVMSSPQSDSKLRLKSSFLQGSLRRFLVNKQKFPFSVNYQITLCESLRFYKHVESIFPLTKCLQSHIFGKLLKSALLTFMLTSQQSSPCLHWFIATFLGSLPPPVDQWSNVKPSAGLCIASPVLSCVWLFGLLLVKKSTRYL